MIFKLMSIAVATIANAGYPFSRSIPENFMEEFYVIKQYEQKYNDKFIIDSYSNNIDPGFIIDVEQSEE